MKWLLTCNTNYLCNNYQNCTSDGALYFISENKNNNHSFTITKYNNPNLPYIYD